MGKKIGAASARAAARRRKCSSGCKALAGAAAAAVAGACAWAAWGAPGLAGWAAGVGASLLAFRAGLALGERLGREAIGSDARSARDALNKAAQGDFGGISKLVEANGKSTTLLHAADEVSKSINALIFETWDLGYGSQDGGGESRELLSEEGHKGAFKVLAQSFNGILKGRQRALEQMKGLQQRALQEEEKFRALAENSPDIIGRFDQAGRLIYANMAFCQETGVKMGDGREDFWDCSGWRATIGFEQFREKIREVMQTGMSARVYMTWQEGDAPGDSLVTYEMQIVAEKDGRGQVAGALAIGRNISERQYFEQKLIKQAQHDALTGLPNRSLLNERLRCAIMNAKKEGGRLAVLFVDLENIKHVNETLGHAMGDELLVEMGKRLKGTLRDCDTVARFGGDDFVVLVEEAGSQQEIDKLVERLFEALTQPCVLDKQRFYPGASLGIAMYPDDGDDAEMLLKHADMAMYAAKADRLVKYRYYAREMNGDLKSLLEVGNRLRQALDGGGLWLAYQPKVDLKTGRVAGLEALLRWKDEKLGNVSPGTFIPLAERLGLIEPIGAWVLQEACRQMAQWRNAGLDFPPVAVNLSARQCRTDAISRNIESALAKHGLPGSCLEVEITESVLMSDVEEATRGFWRLRELGVGVSVDDFGTGYSSLSYLKKLPVTKLKIDKSFVDDIAQDKNSLAIVKAIVRMGHSLDLEIVCEGVESAQQAELLVKMRCDQIQGYYFSRPVPAAQAEALFGEPFEIPGK